MVNRTSATRMTYFRPSRSANIPARGLAIKANRLVEDVIRLLSRVESGRERSDLMDTKVEEMTPVLGYFVSLSYHIEFLWACNSYPNSIPLIPAANERAQMKVLGEVDRVSSDTKLPLRPSRLSLGLSGSGSRGVSAIDPLLDMSKMF